MIEHDVEQRLVDKVKELGGKCYKFVSPGNAGVPDRIVVCNGYTVFVELKKPEDYKFAKLQKFHRDEIHRNGGFCILIKNYEEVDKFIDILKKGRTMIECTCAMCGKKFKKYPSQIVGRKHLFCSYQCLGDYSNKKKNPDGYKNLKSYESVSKHMTELNKDMNPTRMNPETRKKLRQVGKQRKASKDHYPKYYGKLEHRVIAEQMLGRPLKPEEVVHHIDRNKHNNDPSNLMVFPNQAEHTRWHLLHDKDRKHGKGGGGK